MKSIWLWAMLRYISIVILFCYAASSYATKNTSRYDETLLLRADLTGNGIINDVYLVSEHPHDGTGYFQSLVIGYGKDKPLLGIRVGGKADKWLSFREMLPNGTLVFDTVYPLENDPLCCPQGKGEFYAAVFEEDIITSDSSLGLHVNKIHHTQKLITQTLDDMIDSNYSIKCLFWGLVPFYNYRINKNIQSTKNTLNIIVEPFIGIITQDLVQKK